MPRLIPEQLGPETDEPETEEELQAALIEVLRAAQLARVRDAVLANIGARLAASCDAGRITDAAYCDAVRA